MFNHESKKHKSRVIFLKIKINDKNEKTNENSKCNRKNFLKRNSTKIKEKYCM